MSRSAEHQRKHNLLLFAKVLRLRDAVSPLTLVLDSVSQSSRPLIWEFATKAKLARETLLVSWDRLKKPSYFDHFIDGHGLDVSSLQARISPLRSKKLLIVLDSINALCTKELDVARFCASLIGPQVSLLAVYHTEVPSFARSKAYVPSHLQVLKHLATTVLTVHSPPEVFARKAASDKAKEPPRFGLENSDSNGTLIGLPILESGPSGKGYIVEMEFRRPSGRPVCECFYLPLNRKGSSSLSREKDDSAITLLVEHPAYKASEDLGLPTLQDLAKGGGGAEEPSSTFELGLTAQQLEARSQVVLPYFDAQNGGNEGGRILYEMSREDDFDEDEDET